uniref:Uncharacterized protein n=2 Tax=Auxenochlorella protothecoides TaxID=3075 RepID=A0A1D1ZWC6_AUXPR
MMSLRAPVPVPARAWSAQRVAPVNIQPPTVRSRSALRAAPSSPSRPSHEHYMDPDLFAVLDLASDAELDDLHDVLHAPSLLSPVLKTLAVRPHADAPPPPTRRRRIARIDAHLRFLAGDALCTLRGGLPSYHQALLGLRRQLRVPCPPSLSAPDLESEVFLHLMRHHLPRVGVPGPGPAAAAALAHAPPSLARRLARRGRDHGSALHRAAAPVALAGGALTQLAAWVGGAAMLSGAQAARLARAVGRQATPGSLAATLTRQPMAASLVRVLGPAVTVSAACEVLLASMGTDYARLCRAVFLLAQIRLLRTHGFVKEGTPGAAGEV